MFYIRLQNCLFSYAGEADAVEQLTLWFKDKIKVLDKGKVSILESEDYEDNTWRTILAFHDSNGESYSLGCYKVYQESYYTSASSLKKEREGMKQHLKTVVCPNLQKFANKDYQSISEIEIDRRKLEYEFSTKEEDFIFYQTFFEFEIIYENVYFEQSIVETLRTKQEKQTRKKVK